MSKKEAPLITPIDFFSGAVAGTTQILVGQPFDIVKVRLQVSGGSSSEVIKSIMAAEGPLGFYKGTVTPLIFMSFCIANQFTGFNFAKRWIAKKKYQGDISKLKISDLVLAGFSSGFWYTWIQSPMELSRIKMQVKTEGGPVYSSSIDAGKKIFQTQGIRGFYFGYIATTIRECIGSAVYFGVYETLVQRTLAKDNRYKSRKDIPKTKICMYGGLAGYLLWTFIYPIDIIKSRMQGSNFENTPYRSTIKTGQLLLQEKGFKGMFAGILPCQSRAIIVNGASFVAFEYTFSFLSKFSKKEIK